jgi:monothiol glutaredoxin
MLTDSLRSQIDELVNKSRVVLFMKGSRHFPQCGFSASVVKVLDELGTKYETVNILQSQEIRDGMKEYSQWPTFPQLYVEGKLVGGADIVRDMHSSGELGKLIGTSPPKDEGPVTAPTFALTDAARAAVLEAQKEEAQGEALRIEVAAGFGYELYFDAKKDDDFVLDAKIPVVMDRQSARRAQNLRVDFTGGGFRIENDAEPPRVRPMRAKDLKQLLDGKESLLLVDVRTDDERRTAKIEGSITADDFAKKQDGLAKDTRLVVMCHHGMRSRQAAERFVMSGFTRVFNLEGGIEAWSTDVDPSVPRY